MKEGKSRAKRQSRVSIQIYAIGRTIERKGQFWLIDAPGVVWRKGRFGFPKAGARVWSERKEAERVAREVKGVVFEGVVRGRWESLSG